MLWVRVHSLNQAYTFASRRLEPNRMTHGGNAYEHMIYVDGKRRLKFEELRSAVELGYWQVPDANNTEASPFPSPPPP
jgi:hypothetical protein